MAQPIDLIHTIEDTVKKAYEGFSWTTLFFGPIPALMRKDYFGAGAILLTLVAAWFIIKALVLPVASISIVSLATAYFYNKWHLDRLIDAGYVKVKTLFEGKDKTGN